MDLPTHSLASSLSRSLGRDSLARSSFAARSFFVLRSKSLRHERTRASGVCSFGRFSCLVQATSASCVHPLSMSRDTSTSSVELCDRRLRRCRDIQRNQSRPSSFLPPPSIAIAPSFSIVVQSPPPPSSSSCLRSPYLAVPPSLRPSSPPQSSTPSIASCGRNVATAIGCSVGRSVGQSVCLSVRREQLIPQFVYPLWARAGAAVVASDHLGHTRSLRPLVLHVGKSRKWDRREGGREGGREGAMSASFCSGRWPRYPFSIITCSCSE